MILLLLQLSNNQIINYHKSIMMIDLFKITGCLNRSRNEAFGESLECTTGLSSKSHSNTFNISLLDMSMPFTRQTLWRICTASSCLPLASNHRTDSGMNLNKITTGNIIVGKFLWQKHVHYYWPLVRCITQGRHSDCQLEVSPIGEYIRKRRR